MKKGLLLLGGNTLEDYFCINEVVFTNIIFWIIS